MLMKRKRRGFACSVRGNRMVRRNPGLTREEAEMLAFQGLQFIAADSGLLGRFLALTGVSPADLRDMATSDDFLSGVLDFFMGDESTLLAFATSRGCDPSTIGMARSVLSREVDDGG